jgi:hypothetical protein
MAALRNTAININRLGGHQLNRSGESGDSGC